jgi:hypothetical protein
MVEMRCFRIMDVMAARREKIRILKSLLRFMAAFGKGILGVYVVLYPAY